MLKTRLEIYLKSMGNLLGWIWRHAVVLSTYSVMSALVNPRDKLVQCLSVPWHFCAILVVINPLTPIAAIWVQQ